jgi:hypothetical protein
MSCNIHIQQAASRQPGMRNLMTFSILHYNATAPGPLSAGLLPPTPNAPVPDNWDQPSGGHAHCFPVGLLSSLADSTASQSRPRPVDNGGHQTIARMMPVVSSVPVFFIFSYLFSVNSQEYANIGKQEYHTKSAMEVRGWKVSFLKF